MGLKALAGRLWRRLDLVADDPGLEREWMSPTHLPAPARAGSRRRPAAQRKASIARSPMARDV